MGANASTAVPVYASGEVLDAARLNLTNAGIPVFADSSARDAAFGGTGEKTLAEGQFAYLEDSNTTQYYDGANFVSLPKGYVLNTSDTATTSITTVTATTILTATVTIVPGRIFSAYGFCAAQSGSIIGAKGLWLEETNSAKKLGLFWTGLAQGANLPFTMGGTTTFSSADVGVTTGSGTSRTFNLRVWFNGGTTTLNTNPDAVVGANSYPQIFTIIDVGNS
jgi:hypothetical protein